MSFGGGRPDVERIILAQNEGIIIRNGPVAMGVGGTARLHVELDWEEVDTYAP